MSNLEVPHGTHLAHTSVWSAVFLPSFELESDTTTHPPKWLEVKKTTLSNDLELEISCINWYNCCGNWSVQPNTGTPDNPSILLLGDTQQNCVHMVTHTHTHTHTHTVQKCHRGTGKTQILEWIH